MALKFKPKYPSIVGKRTMPDGPVKGESIITKVTKLQMKKKPKYRLTESGKMKY